MKRGFHYSSQEPGHILWLRTCIVTLEIPEAHFLLYFRGLCVCFNHGLNQCWFLQRKGWQLFRSMSQCGSKLNEALAIATLKDRTVFLILPHPSFQRKPFSLLSCFVSAALESCEAPGLACFVPSIMCVHLCLSTLFTVLIT